MLPKASQTTFSPRLHERLMSLFHGGNGFGLILFFWAFVGSLIGAVTLVAAGIAYWSWWTLFLGLLALRCYAYLGGIGRELLDKLTPYDG